MQSFAMLRGAADVGLGAAVVCTISQSTSELQRGVKMEHPLDPESRIAGSKSFSTVWKHESRSVASQTAWPSAAESQSEAFWNDSTDFAMWQVGYSEAYGSGASGPVSATEMEGPHRDQAISAATQSLMEG